MPIASINHPSRKTKFESARIPLSFGLGLVWVGFLISTKAQGFESAVYDFVELGGFFLIFVAVLGRLWATLYIGGRKDSQLCTTGPYSLTRNPLYLFSFLGVVGVCLAAQNLILTGITALLFLAYYHVIIRKEETRLREMFGVAWEDYATRVPRFLPRWQGPDTADVVEVNVRIFTRSLGDVGWFLVAIIAIELVEDMRIDGVLGGWVLPY